MIPSALSQDAISGSSHGYGIALLKKKWYNVMREYELCCEIFNQCSNNQMRDVDFQEVSVEDTDAYIRALEPRAEIQREDLSDGAVVYHTNTAGLLKRYSFTPI